MAKRVIIVGGGVAGMSAAIALKKLGANPLLIEKSGNLGGMLNSFKKLCFNSNDTKYVINHFTSELSKNDIKTLLCTEVIAIKTNDDSLFEVNTACGNNYEADALIIATGAKWIDPTLATEFGYGVVDNVITLYELESKMAEGEVLNTSSQLVKNIALIHCVCSRDIKTGVSYCSKMCCSSALRSAIELKKMLGEGSHVYEFYTDMRVWAEKGETLYRTAKQSGVELIRGGVSEIKPFNDKLELWAEDMTLQRNLRLELDMVVLVTGVKGRDVNHKFANSLNIDVNNFGYFVNPEKLISSIETSRENIYTIGCASSPKSVEESIYEGQSAALAISDYLNHK